MTVLNKRSILKIAAISIVSAAALVACGKKETPPAPAAEAPAAAPAAPAPAAETPAAAPAAPAPAAEGEKK